MRAGNNSWTLAMQVVVQGSLGRMCTRIASLIPLQPDDFATSSVALWDNINPEMILRFAAFWLSSTAHLVYLCSCLMCMCG